MAVTTDVIHAYDVFDLAAFLEHGRAYARGQAQRPWCRSNTLAATDGLEHRTLFTFDDELLAVMLKFPGEFKKDLRAALNYGFLGSSSGGRNGIMLLRSEDLRMQNKARQYVEKREDFLREDCDIRAPEGVKIVVHRMNGLRTIGVRDRSNGNTVFFDQLQYSQ